MMFYLRIIKDDSTIAFIKWRWVGIVTALSLAMISLVLFTWPGLNYGIDFQGGVLMEVHSPQAIDQPALRAQLELLNLGESSLQSLQSPDQAMIRLQRQPGGEQEQQQATSQLRQALERDFPYLTVQRVEVVGATVSRELLYGGLVAVGLGLLSMLGYIWFRFEWQFALGALTTLLLDVCLILGFFALTQLSFTLASVAAVLTIIGYSINDKVVVYDRIRENLRLYKKLPLPALLDRSINSTLNRTVGTSLTSLLAVTPLAIFAGQALKGFAWALMLGITIGTLSSIFVAAPILLLLGEKSLHRNPEQAQLPSTAKSQG